MQNSSRNICASNTILEAVQRSAKAEDMGEGLFQGGPMGSCLVILSRLDKAFLADTFIL